MKRFFVILILVLFSTCAMAEMAVSMNPPNREFFFKSFNKPQQDVIELENQGISPAKFKVYVTGFSISPEGELLFENNNYSAEKWITISPPSIQIKPYDFGVIRYKISVPEGTLPGTYTASIMMEEEKELPPGEKRAQFLVKGRFSHIIYVNVGTPEQNVELESFSIKPSGKELKFLVRINNKGNYYYRPIGTIKIEGKKAKEISVPTIPILGNSARTVSVSLPASELPPGRYKAALKLEMYKKPALQMTKEFVK